jgi:isocitrate dehydrogenase (NAD+)
MHTVALISGDGIGPEISDATQKVLEAAGVKIDWQDIPAGAAAKQTLGAELPWSSLETIRSLGVALKAPLIAPRCSGGVVVEGDGQVRRYPSVNNALRRELGAFVNVRPAQGWQGVSERYSSMNVVIMREVTEDIYSGLERCVGDDSAEAIKRITGNASRRLARFACDYAVRHRRRKVTAIHKANVLHLTDGLFLRSVRSVAGEYPGLAFEEQAVDAACYLLVKKPELFDVMVLPNQYGDILSDLVAGLAGSLGLAPGANFGNDVAVFEAAHGAAPEIAGQGLANPIGLILSGALLLDHIGEHHPAGRVWNAVARVLSERRHLTPDLGGNGTTVRLTQAVCEAVVAT